MNKKFTAYMLYDWKSNKAKITTRYDKKKLGPYIIPLRIELDIKIPEIREHKLSGTITIPDVMVEDMMVEEVVEELAK